MTVLARSFNGDTDFITVSASSSALNPQTCTMAAWVYIDPTFAIIYNTIMGGYVTSTPSQDHALYIRPGSGANAGLFTISAYFGTGQIDNSGGAASFQPYTWVHVALTVSSGGTVLKSYLNGVLDQTAATTFSPAAAPFGIGVDPTDSDIFGGFIADPAIWNTVLTGTQIAQLAAGRRAYKIGANANLVGYWPFRGESPERDFSGNGNNGVLNGTPLVVGGPPLLDPLTYARAFDGAKTTGITCSPSSLLLNPSVFTMAGWLYITDPTFGGFDFLMGNADGPANHTHLLMGVGDGTSHYVALSLLGSGSLTGAIQWNVNTWVHLVSTTSGSVQRLYVNGVQESASGSIATYSPVAAGFYLGADGAPGSGDFSLLGYLADAAIWNTVLSGAQITNLAAGRRADRIGANANLIGYWPIVDRSPETDYSGNGNHGVLSPSGITTVLGPPLLDPYPDPITMQQALFM